MEEKEESGDVKKTNKRRTCRSCKERRWNKQRSTPRGRGDRGGEGKERRGKDRLSQKVNNENYITGRVSMIVCVSATNTISPTNQPPKICRIYNNIQQYIVYLSCACIYCNRTRIHNTSNISDFAGNYICSRIDLMPTREWAPPSELTTWNN